MVLRVLVIDDHAIVREGLRRLVNRDEGIKIVGEAASKEKRLHRSLTTTQM